MNSTKALFNKQAAQKSAERQQLLQRPAYESNVPYITRAFVKEIDLEGGRFNKFNPINSIKADVPQLPKYPDEDSDNSGYPIFYPLLSPHLMLPLKIGEEVIVLFENISNTTLGFWLCRAPEIIQTDDVNFVDAVEKRKLPFITQADKLAGVTTDDIELDELTLSGVDSAGDTSQRFEDLQNNKQPVQVKNVRFKQEIVPHLKKESSGDLVLQGSNNSAIILSLDRSGTKEKTGVVDVVVGRGAALQSAPNVKNSKRDKENIKATEGSVSYDDDAARVIIMMKSNVDTLFKTTQQGAVNDDGKSFVVTKSDAIRIIARSSIKIETQNGNAIVLKPDGEIIIHGSKIKIGTNNSSEQLVLGNKLVAALSRFLDTLNAGNVGNLGAPIPGITAAVSSLRVDLQTVLSQNKFTE